ncbi:hypothetical protein BJ508DRAFT_414663 [Ascobolus immersus RN42]|uniref:Uncharacterized protein n=1 Tax=Ascobolus immersus RN42 TaxID=1160509 RepID=A0A3N4IBQ7_ASCIM|nr:hypothetical protein BJ508DRAFT_414663 [Ascobolus immersus RN42]
MRSSLYLLTLFSVLAFSAPIPQDLPEATPIEIPAEIPVEAPIEAPIEVPVDAVEEPLDIPPASTDELEFIEVPPVFPDDPAAEPPTGTDPSLDDFTSNLDFGFCTDPTMVFLPGVNGRRVNEFTFLPNNSDGFFDTQGEALDAGTIASFICDNLVNSCQASAEAQAACKGAEEVVREFGDLKDQSVADAFNAALGFSFDDEPLEEEVPVEEGLEGVPVLDGPVEEVPEVELALAPAVAV